MKISKSILAAIFILLMVGALAFAAESNGGHEAGSDRMSGMDMQQDEDIFLEEKEIDGYTVSFHVMKAVPGAEQEGSHNLMIKIEEEGRALDDAVVNSKVIAPDGKSESKLLRKMGDWYMNGYDLGEQGKYQLIILFKTPDGEKHNGGVYYETEK